MPRPRFLKLPEEKRKEILTRASAEFVEHGYAGASLNRLLEAAQLSKGSFYYYFDDRDDLYGAVLQHELIFKEVPKGVFEVTSADDYWAAIETWIIELYEQFFASPNAMALTRDLATVSGSQGMPPAVMEIVEASHKIMVTIMEAGQKVGAVRTDLPQDLLVAVALKVGEALDLWTGAHLEEISEQSAKDMCGLSLPLFQRLLQP